MSKVNFWRSCSREYPPKSKVASGVQRAGGTVRPIRWCGSLCLITPDTPVDGGGVRGQHVAAVFETPLIDPHAPVKHGYNVV